MSDAPERIWAWAYTGSKISGGWNIVQLSYAEAEYLRADIAEARIAELEAEVARLRQALDSIVIYASDTLSGPVNGPDDRKFQRDCVVELCNRALRALDGEGEV